MNNIYGSSPEPEMSQVKDRTNGSSNFIMGTNNQSRPSPPPDDIFTYRRLRRMIGILGVALPVILVLFSWIPLFDTSIQPSISHYYYTNLREIFTGTLCGVGLFLICYKGHHNPVFWKNDNFLTNVAGVMAFGVAFFPTFQNEDAQSIQTLVSGAEWIGWFHYACAAFLFISFSLLAINVFTIGQNVDPSLPKTRLNENNIYKFCGYSILVFIVLVPVTAWLDLFEYSTLVFEALSLFAFGTAWLIKGRALGDKGKIGEVLYKERN